MQPFKKSLIALVILAVLLGIWAIVNRKTGDYTPPPRDVVFSALRAAISPGDVGRITVTGDKDKELVIARKDGEWTLPSLHEYPADKKFVDELIVDLMKLGEERLEARAASSHADFEVDAEKGKKIALADRSGKDLWALVVGKSVSGSMNRGFVRLDGKDEVYSVAPSLSWKLKTYGDDWSRNWLNSTLVEFNKDKGEDVAKIEVIRADGESFTVEKVEEEKPIEEPAPGGDAEKEAGEETPKTVKETKWYVVAANGERFEADSSARSGFTSQFDRFTGTDPVKPAPLADYGLEPAYLTLRVTTSFTKEEFKSEKPRTYEILVGAQVPEEEKKDEAPQADAAPAPAAEAAPAPAAPDAPPAPAPDVPPTPAPETAPPPAPAADAPTTEAPAAPPTSTESGGSSAIQDAAEPPPPPPEPVPTPASPPVAEPPPPALPPTELPAEAPPQAPAGEVVQPEGPVEAPAADPAPAEPPKPKFKTDRYVTVRGDRRIMTVAEWKLKSIDKKAEDFKPKKEEPKPAEAGPPAPAEAGPPAPAEAAPAEAAPPAPAEAAPPPPAPAEKPAAVQYGARHILIAYQGSTSDAAVTRSKEEAQKKAGELLAELQKDAGKFAELAKQWSDCPSKNDGGDLGTFGEGQMVPAFESAVKELKVGALSGVVETQYGFHIVERTK